MDQWDAEENQRNHLASSPTSSGGELHHHVVGLVDQTVERRYAIQH